MGIKNFHQFMKKNAPNAYRNIHISEYEGKSIAIDISGLIYKYKIIAGDKWLDAFINLIFTLRKNRVHPIFVFDGKAPQAKDNEKNKRNEQKIKQFDKVFNFRQELDNYYSTGEVTDFIRDEMKKLGPPSIGNVMPINTNLLEKKYSYMNSQIVNWSPEDIELLHQIFDCLEIPHAVSQSEAETLCASLEIEGKVSAVVSNDSDVCVYGVHKFLYELNGLDGMCVEIDTKEILKSLSFTQEQFIDFCIMCGCDYNENIPNVGPVNSYKLIKEYKSIDNLPSNYDISILNHIESRSLFATRYSYEKPSIICSQPTEKNLIEVASILQRRNSKITFENIKKVFSPTEIIFQ